MEIKDKRRKPVAVFNSSYLLIAVFRSIKEASDITGIVRQSIIKAIAGDVISANGYYWRNIPQDYMLEQDDMGTLLLMEFDKEIGNPDRKIWKKKKINSGSTIMESQHQQQY